MVQWALHYVILYDVISSIFSSCSMVWIYSIIINTYIHLYVSLSFNIYIYIYIQPAADSYSDFEIWPAGVRRDLYSDFEIKIRIILTKIRLIKIRWIKYDRPGFAGTGQGSPGPARVRQELIKTVIAYLTVMLTSMTAATPELTHAPKPDFLAGLSVGYKTRPGFATTGRGSPGPSRHVQNCRLPRYSSLRKGWVKTWPWAQTNCTFHRAGT